MSEHQGQHKYEKRFAFMAVVAAVILITAGIAVGISKESKISQNNGVKNMTGQSGQTGTGSQSSQILQAGTGGSSEQTAQVSAGSPSEQTAQISAGSPPEQTEQEEQAQKILNQMSLHQKICQMFFVTPEALTQKKTAVTEADKELLDGLEKNPVGGVICFAGNIQDGDQIKKMMEGMQEAALKQQGIPLFTGVDEEGGSVARIADCDKIKVTKFPDMRDVSSEEQAYQVGDTIGTYLKEYGFNLDFAPDADVLTNPQNKVIGKRSFGSSPADVTAKALAVYQGLGAQHVLAVFKHFPGHGGTTGDTHDGFAFTDRTYEEIEKEELVPFQAAVTHKVPLILVAHIAVPKITGDNTPASLSDKIVSGLLREKMQYQGLIITDALNMGAIEKIYTSSRAAVMAVQAGDDLLLMPEDFPAALQAVENAVSTGQITQERIDESVKKIIITKLSMQETGQTEYTMKK